MSAKTTKYSKVNTLNDTQSLQKQIKPEIKKKINELSEDEKQIFDAMVSASNEPIVADSASQPHTASVGSMLSNLNGEKSYVSSIGSRSTMPTAAIDIETTNIAYAGGGVALLAGVAAVASGGGGSSSSTSTTPTATPTTPTPTTPTPTPPLTPEKRLTMVAHTAPEERPGVPYLAVEDFNYTLSYDTNGYLTEINYGGFIPVTNAQIINDAYGYATEIITTVMHEAPSRSTTIYRNANHDVLEFREYDFGGTITKTNTMSYDATGKLMQSIYQYSDNSPISTTYTMNADGFIGSRVIDYKDVNDTDETVKYTYEFNDKHQPIKVIADSNIDTHDFTEEFTYNSLGLKVKSSCVYTTGELQAEGDYSTTFEYDADGYLVHVNSYGYSSSYTWESVKPAGEAAEIAASYLNNSHGLPGYTPENAFVI